MYSLVALLFCLAVTVEIVYVIQNAHASFFTYPIRSCQ